MKRPNYFSSLFHKIKSDLFCGNTGYQLSDIWGLLLLSAKLALFDLKTFFISSG